MDQIRSGKPRQDGLRRYASMVRGSIVLTLDTYSHVLSDMQQQAAERIEKLLFA
jgi:hypothetical protein